MIAVYVELDYGPDTFAEERYVSFLLHGSDPVAVHEQFAAALEQGDGYTEWVDVRGDTWPFWVETIRRLGTRSRQSVI